MIFTLQLLSSLRMKGHAQTAISAALAILGWTAIYYATSIGSTVWNARLVDGGHVSVTVLTLLHLLVSLSSDIAIMHYGTGEGAPKLASDSRRHSIWEIARAFLPISLFVVMSKLTTYLSYRTVSVGLSHTAKASEPLFNVLVARAVFGERRSPVVYLSLVPIALGVTLASLTDFSYNTTGFLWAVASALLKVLQNIFVKRVMQSGRFTFMEVHFYCGVAALLVLMPVMLLQAATASSNPFAHFPLLALLACSLLQYGSSLASYRVLHLTAHLTATIINVMKRLLTIVLATLAADAPMSPLNATGVILAVAGIMSYQVLKDAAPTSGPAQPLSWRSWLQWLSSVAWRYNHLPFSADAGKAASEDTSSGSSSSSSGGSSSSGSSIGVSGKSSGSSSPSRGQGVADTAVSVGIGIGAVATAATSNTGAAAQPSQAAASGARFSALAGPLQSRAAALALSSAGLRPTAAGAASGLGVGLGAAGFLSGGSSISSSGVAGGIGSGVGGRPPLHVAFGLSSGAGLSSAAVAAASPGVRLQSWSSPATPQSLLSPPGLGLAGAGGAASFSPASSQAQSRSHSPAHASGQGQGQGQGQSDGWLRPASRMWRSAGSEPDLHKTLAQAQAQAQALSAAGSAAAEAGGAHGAAAAGSRRPSGEHLAARLIALPVQ